MQFKRLERGSDSMQIDFEFYGSPSRHCTNRAHPLFCEVSLPKKIFMFTAAVVYSNLFNFKYLE